MTQSNKWQPNRHGVTTLFAELKCAIVGGGIWSGWDWGDSSTWDGSRPDSPYFQRVLIGSKNLTANLGPPMIVLTADSGSNFGPPEQPGQTTPVPLLSSRHITFSAHCWGRNHAGAEDLADAVFTALHDTVTCGNARIEGETWEDSGHDAGGVMLIRQFRASGFSIQRIKLPLDRPAQLDNRQTVTSATISTISVPFDDSGDMSVDVSTGVKLDG